MSEPSPRPWRYQKETTTEFGRKPIRRFEIYRASDGPFAHPATCEREADAEFIVRVVNSHQALVDALVAAAAAMDHMGDVLNGMDAVDEEEDGAHFAAFEKVRLALKLAGVKPMSGPKKWGPHDHFPGELCERSCPALKPAPEVKPTEEHPECSICRRRHGREVEHACE